jgi:hypothetical protein
MNGQKKTALTHAIGCSLRQMCVLIDIILTIIRQAWHVPCMGEKRNAHMVSWGNLMERDHLEDLGTDRKII